MVKCKVRGCKIPVFFNGRSFDPKEELCPRHYFEGIVEAEIEVFKKKPILRIQRARRKAIIKDMAFARIKVKSRKLK